MIQFKYKVFGLNISSDYEIDFLVKRQYDEDTEVAIICGDVPDRITTATVSNEYFQADDDRFLLDIQNVARFYVEDGKKITIKPAQGSNIHNILLYLMGSVFGILLYQRGILPIHGSGIVINGGCVVFTGDSGAGKSTIIRAFSRLGYSVVTDDVVAVTINQAGNILVHPSYPQQKLWKDSVTCFNVNSDHLQQVSEVYEKYYLPFNQGFQESPVVLQAICELVPSDTDAVRIEKITNNIAKFDLVIRNTYRGNFIKDLSLQRLVFQQWGVLVNKIPIYKMVRPTNQYTLDDQISLMLSELNKL